MCALPALVRPELLAPAGGVDAMRAAVHHGADAVYFGVGSLNARAGADNLRPEQLPGIVRWLHARGVKAYMTLNLPFRARDEREVSELIGLAEASAVDALIVRDPIIMHAVRELAPTLTLHASTQFTVHSVESARRAVALGCRRAVLARELSREQIRRIRHEVPDLELGLFVFGSLCVAVSGQCLLGHVIDGQSGNHGRCVQACRMPFKDEQGNPLGAPLSMKDLNLLRRVAELCDLGVRAFVIEGRMKRPAWVGCVTRAFRRALDNHPPGLSARDLAEFERDLSILFSRPRTDGPLRDELDAREVIDPDATEHQGLRLPSFSLVSRDARQLLRFVAPVDLATHDELLLELERHSEPRLLPIRELMDTRGGTPHRIRAGRSALVPLPTLLDARVTAVYVHAADSLVSLYARDGKPVDTAAVRGELPTPDFELVTVRAGSLFARLSRGPVVREASVPIRSEPTTGAGLDALQAGRVFPRAEFDIAPALHVDVSELKRARRELLRGFDTSWWERVTSITEAAYQRLRARRGERHPSDDELLEMGPAAVSRVAGLPEGVLVAPGGARLRVEAVEDGAVIWRESGPEDA